MSSHGMALTHHDGRWRFAGYDRHRASGIRSHRPTRFTRQAASAIYSPYRIRSWDSGVTRGSDETLLIIRLARVTAAGSSGRFELGAMAN